MKQHSSFVKLLTVLLSVCMMLPAFASASEAAPVLSIVASNFPAFDFARQMAGDSAEVTMLLPPGSESHSYEPTPQDIIAIQESDLFVYVGGESDHWIEEILASMGVQRPRTFRLTDCVETVSEKTSESMETHHHHHDENEQHAEHHGEEMDEHVWTSPKNVMEITRQLSAVLSELRPENADMYEERFQAYFEELTKLDQTFADIVANGQRKIMIFGDRFPLRYFADAYGLDYDAAFPGCSEDSEPSVRTVASLVERVKTEQIPVVFYIEFSSRRTADIIAEETGAKELLFHCCHNVSAEEMESGASYLTLMQQNAQALKEALN